MKSIISKTLFLFIAIVLGTFIVLPTLNSFVNNFSVGELGLVPEVFAQNTSGEVSQNNTTTIGDSVLCTIFPFLRGIAFAGNLCGGDSGAANAVGLGVTLVQTVLSLVFVWIIAVAVYTIIRAAIKYIRSEGDNTKVEAAQKSIRTVFVGIGALLVGIVGLAIVIALFGASGGLTPNGGIDTDTLQTCLQNGGTLESCTQGL